MRAGGRAGGRVCAIQISARAAQSGNTCPCCRQVHKAPRRDCHLARGSNTLFGSQCSSQCRSGSVRGCCREAPSGMFKVQVTQVQRIRFVVSNCVHDCIRQKFVFWLLSLSLKGGPGSEKTHSSHAQRFWYSKRAWILFKELNRAHDTNRAPCPP